MKRQFTALALIAALISAFTFTPLVDARAAAAPTSGISIPITGTGTAGTFTGVFNVTSFAVNQAGQLVANGTIIGTVTSATGVVTSIVQTVSSLVTSPNSSCTILHLVLGPITLDVLGLVITTNQIVIDISAQPGPGNLLGNLLCAVANLLNGGGSLTQIAHLLNQLLALL